MKKIIFASLLSICFMASSTLYASSTGKIRGTNESTQVAQVNPLRDYYPISWQTHKIPKNTLSPSIQLATFGRPGREMVFNVQVGSAPVRQVCVDFGTIPFSDCTTNKSPITVDGVKYEVSVQPPTSYSGTMFIRIVKQ